LFVQFVLIAKGLDRMFSVILFYVEQNVFTQSLESGDRQKAMKRLRVPPLGEKVHFCWHVTEL
jgi:hypothetical protein